MSKIDVLVVGAGPTGLFMAAELARFGLSCRIIDKASGPSDKSKALAIQARTLEVFGHVGIADEFIREGLILRGANPVSRGKPIAHLSFHHIDSPYPFVLSLEQSKTEAILTRHLSGFGVKVERDIELIGLKEEGEGVTATLRSSSKKEEAIRVSWVIGCDGAHSTVRKNFHLSFKGKLLSDIFSLADVKIDWKYPHDELYAFLNPEGVIAAIPMVGKERYRLVFQLPRCRGKAMEEVAPPTMEEAQEMLQKFGDEKATLSDPLWMAHFHIHSRLTNCYRKGRIFLAGDAAHIHSPVGGQGMNTGLQDVFNLAWKLAFVHQERAPEALLDTYHRERHSFGKKLLRGTEIATFFTTLRNPWAVSLRNWALGKLLKFPSIQKKFLGALSQTSFEYPNHETRAPNGPILDTDLYTLWKNTKCYHLLLFTGPNPTEKTIKKLEEIALKEASPTLTPLLIRSEETHRRYKVDRPTTYLIRPDMYIETHSSLSLRLCGSASLR